MYIANQVVRPRNPYQQINGIIFKKCENFFNCIMDCAFRYKPMVDFLLCGICNRDGFFPKQFSIRHIVRILFNDLFQNEIIINIAHILASIQLYAFPVRKHCILHYQSIKTLIRFLVFQFFNNFPYFVPGAVYAFDVVC